MRERVQQCEHSSAGVAEPSEIAPKRLGEVGRQLVLPTRHARIDRRVVSKRSRDELGNKEDAARTLSDFARHDLGRRCVVARGRPKPRGDVCRDRFRVGIAVRGEVDPLGLLRHAHRVDPPAKSADCDPRPCANHSFHDLCHECIRILSLVDGIDDDRPWLTFQLGEELVREGHNETELVGDLVDDGASRFATRENRRVDWCLRDAIPSLAPPGRVEHPGQVA